MDQFLDLSEQDRSILANLLSERDGQATGAGNANHMESSQPMKSTNILMDIEKNAGEVMNCNEFGIPDRNLSVRADSTDFDCAGGEISEELPHDNDQLECASDSSKSSATLVDGEVKANERKEKQALSAKKHRKRKKEELQYLRHRYMELQEQLGVMQCSITPHWKNEVQEETLKRRKSELENHSLKDQLQTQMQIAQKLQEMYLSKSALFQPIQSKEFVTRLSSVPEERIKTFNMLLDMDMHALPAKLQACTEFIDINSVNLPYMGCRTHYEGDLVQIEARRMAVFPKTEKNMLSRVLWHLIHYQFHEIFNLDDMASSTILHKITPEMFYTRYQCRLGFKTDNTLPAYESYSICKIFYRGDAIVIAWRCILEDDLYPFEKSVARHNEHGAVVLQTETLQDGSFQTIAKSISYFSPPVNALDTPTGLFTESILGAVHDYSETALELLRNGLERLKLGQIEQKLCH